MLLFTFLWFLPFVLSSHHSLPKNFKLCKRNDDNFNFCLRKSIPDAIDKMRKGLPSLHVPQLEPLYINELDILQGAGKGPVNLKLHFKNLQMYGIPDSRLISEEAKFDDAKLIAEAFTPRLWFESQYTGDGRVILIPIRGRGKCNITLVDLHTHMELEFENMTKSNETYWRMKNFKINLHPKRLVMYFENLLDTNKEMNDHIVRFLNDNWQPIFEELKPSYEVAFGKIFKEITDRIFSRVPIRKVFPLK